MIPLCELPQPVGVFEAAYEVLKSGKYVKGKLAQEFADKFAKISGKKYGIPVGSGAQALEIAVEAVFGRGMQTITYTPWTFVAVPNAIRRVGHIALPDSKQPQIFAHHLHDERLDYTPKIEDCSHCHGYKPKAKTAIFSLFPTKILGACGEAGIIVTDDAKVANKCREIADHGKGMVNQDDPKGTNARMDEIQAAILLAKLPYLDEWIERRREIVDMYDKAIGRRTPGKYHYMYCMGGTQDTVDKLKSMGIESKLVYDNPFVALPLYPEMTNEQVQEVIKCVTQL